MAERGPYIDPSYWEPPDDPDTEDRFFEAFEDAVREAGGQPCPMGCGGLTEDVAGGPCESCWDAAPKGGPS